MYQILNDDGSCDSPVHADLSEACAVSTLLPQVIMELIYTVGMYHAVSFLTNGLALENEAFGERFPKDDEPA